MLTRLCVWAMSCCVVGLHRRDLRQLNKTTRDGGPTKVASTSVELRRQTEYDGKEESVLGDRVLPTTNHKHMRMDGPSYREDRVRAARGAIGPE